MSKGASLATSAAKTFVVGKVRGTISDGPADEALVARLLTLPTATRIHSWPLPDSVPYPAFVIQRYGARDDTQPLGRNAPVVATTVRLQIKAVCEGYDESPIEEPAGILNELIDGKTAIVDVVNGSGGLYGTFYVECSRESELLVDLEPEPDGTPYQHQGGIYSFYVSRVG